MRRWVISKATHWLSYRKSTAGEKSRANIELIVHIRWALDNRVISQYRLPSVAGTPIQRRRCTSAAGPAMFRAGARWSEK